MKDGENTKVSDLAQKVEVVESGVDFHPSIRALVKILARKAAEERYEEFLEVVRDQFGEDIDK